jgi:hypothetical protein
MYANLPFKDIIGIQPMTRPVDKVFALEQMVEDDDGKPTAMSRENSGNEKLQLEMTANNVEARSRKLQACWAIEAEEDLAMFHDINIHVEMIQALAQEMVQEHTFEVLNDLKVLGGEAEIVELEGSKEEQLRSLMAAIKHQSFAIGSTTRRGWGNFIVVSQALGNAISESKFMNFKPKETGSFTTSDLMELGTIGDGIRVYSALNIPDDEITIGYKGTSDTDTGYIYCPYVPVMTTGVVVHPTTFQPLMSFMTRYGKHVTDNVRAYYRNIKLESKYFNPKTDDE